MGWKLPKVRGDCSADYAARWARGDFDTTNPTDLPQPPRDTHAKPDQAERDRHTPPPAPPRDRKGRW